MKRLLLVVFSLILTSHAWATPYFMSPSGSDSNNGLSTGAPWASPHHNINCGDTVTAAIGTYASSNLQNGKWGTITCSSSNLAFLICATFDGCKTSSTTGDAIYVDQDYWAVVGWETTTTVSGDGACFRATPSGAYILHHVAFIDDIANGCRGGGFVTYDTSTTRSEDYIAFIGDIAYNAASGAGACYSGFSVYQPISSDSNAGTHIYFAGNFSYDNVDGACNGGAPTDGEGYIFDTWDFSQGGGTAYTQQGVMYNNISYNNGGRGVEVVNNSAGSSHATIYIEYMTSYGNSTDLTQTGGCFDRGELYGQSIKDVTWLNDLAQTRTGTSCSSEPLYGFGVLSGDATSNISNSWWYSAAGHNTDPNTSSSILGTGNTIGTNPVFVGPSDPGSPSCGSFPSTTACMATFIANMAPTSGSSTSTGYQAVSNTSRTDALFPQWLCTATGVMNSNIPANLVTPGCGVSGASAFDGLQGVTLKGVVVQ